MNFQTLRGGAVSSSNSGASGAALGASAGAFASIGATVRSALAGALAGLKLGPKLFRTARKMFGRKARRAAAAQEARRRRRADRAARLQAQVSERLAARASELAFANRALEPRIVFDGAGVATADEALQAAEASEADTQADADAQGESERNAADLAAAVAAGVAPDQRSEVIFLDAGVEAPDAILSALPAGAEVILIDRTSDGVMQIADALSGRSDIDAIHIISHGDAGALHLGNATLTDASMRGEHADELAVIGAALSEAGDVLLYGCDFGADAPGASAVETFKELTGADIAASDDATGAAELGGDWELEVEAGAIEAQAIEATAWNGVLV
ncbi:MAG: DUF4347 domain-containing protein, partial [Pseudomonadota bacterium]